MQHAFVDSVVNDQALVDDDPIVAPLVREQLEALVGGRRDGGVGAPERALMQAILQDAILCLLGDAGPGKERDRLAADARYWIELRSRAWIFSFESVCDALDIDPDYARTHLLRMADKRGVAKSSPSGSEPAPRDGCSLRGFRKGGSRPRRAIHFMAERRRRRQVAAS
jgi:hypothetical protein